MGSFKGVLRAGKTTLDVKTRGMTGEFFKDGSSLKLSLERLDEPTFWELFLDYYFFRNDKKYNAARKLLARAGVRNKTPMEMEYVQQQYKLRIPYKEKGRSGQIWLIYSPVVGRIVARRA